MPIQHVALVGHCGFDSGPLSRLAQRLAPDAEVLRINDQKKLDPVATAGTLLLVNRVLDGRFTAGGSGIDLIRSLSESADAPAMMLVSNYADAQVQAVAAGALPGFGKSEMGDPATVERLSESLAALSA